MSEQLVVRLGSQPLDPVFWLVWSQSEQEIIASGELPDAHQLHTLSERAGHRPITALVPGTDVLLKQVQLPAKASRKALAAIPFMLEDELSADIDQQFFALGDKQDDLQNVAIVEKQKIETWLDWIAEAGLVCDKMLPDILALPVSEGSWSLLQLGSQLMLRQDLWLGLQGETSWFLPAVSHYAKQQEQALLIDNYTDMALPPLPNVEIRTQKLDMPMQILALGAQGANFNLLQGEFKQKKQSQGQWQKWRLAAVLATIALLTSLIDKGIELSQLKSQNQQLTQQIHAEFKRAFPETRRIVNVRSQMKQKMQALEQGGSGTSMLAILSQLSDAFASSKVKPQTMRFDSKRSELRLQAVAANFEALEQFKRAAQAQGFEVEQGAINNKDGQVMGSLLIRS